MTSASMLLTIVIESRQLSLRDISNVVGCEPDEGSKEIEQGEHKSLWKKHFDDSRNATDFNRQIESACVWLEERIGKIRNAFAPQEYEIVAMVGMCFSTFTGTVSFRGEMLRRLSSVVDDVEISYYPTSPGEG